MKRRNRAREVESVGVIVLKRGYERQMAKVMEIERERNS